jgi:hypothetical protein
MRVNSRYQFSILSTNMKYFFYYFFFFFSNSIIKHHLSLPPSLSLCSITTNYHITYHNPPRYRHPPLCFRYLLVRLSSHERTRILVATFFNFQKTTAGRNRRRKFNLVRVAKEFRRFRTLISIRYKDVLN